MKNYVSFLVLILFYGLNPGLLAQNTKISKPLVEVFYFHSTHRCPTCLSIEANTKKTLESQFAKELKDGRIKLTVLNSDEDKNKTLCEKYNAFGATLILVKYANNKEITEDMTNFAFSYSRSNPDKFINGLTDKINLLIK